MSYGKQVLAALILTAAGAANGARAEIQPPLGQGPLAAGNRDVAPTTNARVSSPYWNNDDPGATGQTDLPAADIRAVPPAMARATQTKWTYAQTQDDLAYALRVSATQFDRRPDVVAAESEQRVAYDALQKERDRALASLNENAAYKASATLSTNLSQQIADERDQDKPDPAHLRGMASVRLNYVQDNRKLESSILERDDAYQKARHRYLDASAKVRDIRQTEALAVMTDPNLTALRQHVAAARIDRLTAASYLVGVVFARDTALDYASYYRRTGYLNNYIGYAGYYGGYGYRY